MDPPINSLEVSQKIDGIKEGPPLFHCNLFDSEVIRRTAHVFLPGLATACVDNTTGDMFKSPASVAADIRKEMVEYLTQRSETFVAESFIQEGEGDPDVMISEHPTDIIADFVDDFASSKRNLFSRVSGWLLSEKREDKIDDFVQEMEINRFWSMDRREAIAQVLVKNVDYKSTFHCDMKVDTAEELDRHINQCNYRSMNCTNEGCRAHFCAVHREKHDLACPFKILQCEQKCSAILVRREMDRHCITVCPMKLVNCPFYSVGCNPTIPLCTVKQHCSEFLHSHLLYILQAIHKEVTTKSLKHRAEQLEQTSSLDQLCDIQDLRYLTRIVKELDAKMGPVEHYAPTSPTEVCNDTGNTSLNHPQEETQAQTKAEEIQVQWSQEPICDKSEVEIQVSASPEPIRDKQEAQIQAQTYQKSINFEPISDKQDTEIQVESSQEPTNDKLEGEIQGKISGESRVDKLEAEIHVQTSRKSIGDKLLPEIQVLTSQEEINDNSKAESPVQTCGELFCDEPEGEVIHSSQRSSADKPVAETQIQTSQESISDELKTDIQKMISQDPISDKHES